MGMPFICCGTPSSRRTILWYNEKSGRKTRPLFVGENLGLALRRNLYYNVKKYIFWRVINETSGLYQLG